MDMYNGCSGCSGASCSYEAGSGMSDSYSHENLNPGKDNFETNLRGYDSPSDSGPSGMDSNSEMSYSLEMSDSYSGGDGVEGSEYGGLIPDSNEEKKEETEMFDNVEKEKKEDEDDSSLTFPITNPKKPQKNTSPLSPLSSSLEKTISKDSGDSEGLEDPEIPYALLVQISANSAKI